MKQPTYPSLYQINTRVWLTALSRDLGRPATLDDIPDATLDRLGEMELDWVWLLSVWCTGELGRKISLEHPDFRHDFEEALSDLCDDDIGGSGFAIAGYQVHPDLGGDDALKRLRSRLAKRGLKLMLDFVPNHMGPDHPWIKDHPDYFVSGTAHDLEVAPKNYTRVKHGDTETIIAYGRDPYFAGWPDTIQLDYSNPATTEAMLQELLRIADQCDGVRCDMAMLILPEVFERTWGRQAHSFWPTATKAVREKKPDFTFMAEVYWDMESTLHQLGFDYAYDKRLYDRLRDGHAKAVREHYYAGLDYQNKLVRFLENHDEPRVATAFNQRNHQAAAVITFLSPGLRFFHDGQFEGRKKRISPHLVRAPKELHNGATQQFYNRLLNTLKLPVLRDGRWQLLHCSSAWDGNESHASYLAFAWQGANGEAVIVCVNYSPNAGQCFVQLPFPDFAGKTIRLTDLMSEARYERDGNDLLSRGLYLELPAWGYHVFDVAYAR
ncbi:MAG TPA: alpha-amylase family glycosyl hydrolase [Chryseolinea sp.]